MRRLACMFHGHDWHAIAGPVGSWVKAYCHRCGRIALVRYH